MASSQRKKNSSLNTHWHNPSSSSINSFHSAITNMELSQLTPPNSRELKDEDVPHSASEEKISPASPSIINPQPIPSPKLEAVKMGRQDSGFSDGVRSQGSSRPTSSSSGRPKTKRSSTSSRPSTRRAPRSTYITQNRSSISSQRPQIRTRHTIPTTQAYTPHQFFHFPTLQDPAQSAEPEPAPLPPPPAATATVHYWTSDSTRRLEYAAIDAANHGLRGFLIRLVPDCILTEAARRTRFADDDDASDAGSVRRYRLVLPEEKEGEGEEEDRGRAKKQQRPSAFRRWTSLGFSRGKN